MTSQINACQLGAFPRMAEEGEDESPHMDMDETDEEAQDAGPAFDDNLDSDVIDITIEEDDRVFMTMVHPVNPQHFVCALSMVSGRLVEASAKNLKPKGFEDIVLTSLHTYADVFSETAFDSLPERRKWYHAIELECEPSPGFHKVYSMTLTEQTEMDAFIEEALATGCIRQSKSPVRGHPSVSLLPLSSPTLPLSICTPYHHLCIISKDRTYSRRLSGPMVRRLPKSRLTDS
jgi:hypothetical protein